VTNSKIKTLMIGCGNIAGGFDFGQSDLPSTHAGAYKHHDKFDITACIDPDKKKLKKFSTVWEVKYAFLNMEEVKISKLDFDVVSICSPTSFHHQNVSEALKLKPKLIFCEKPLANTYDEAVDIKNMCEQAGVLLAVNHTRRWDPKVIELRNKIAKGDLGEVRSVVGYYNKGVLNNGSHMVDLLLNLFGSLNVITAIRAMNDHFKDDLTVSALLDTKSGLPIHLVGAHASDYAFFELEVIGSKQCVTMRDGGFNWSSRKVFENIRFKGYKNLKKDKYSKGKYFQAMIGAVENIYNAITKGEKLLCTGQEACAAQKICHDLSRIALLNINNR
jgi:predicted dehydrogenase